MDTPGLGGPRIKAPAGIIEALIDAGVQDLEKREGSRTVLEWAVEYGHVEVVRMLLRKGCDAESAAHLVPELMASQKGVLANEINMYMNREGEGVVIILSRYN